MKRKLLIKLLELLEGTYPRHCKAEKLKRRLGLKSLDGKLSRILRYLKDTEKINIVFPESRISQTGRYKLDLWLMSVDEITITPEGIDFLTELKRLETDQNRSNLLLDSSIVLMQIAVIGIALAIYEKFDLNLSNPSVNIPWLLSVIIWIVFISFSMLLLFKILNIIFSKESWRGIFFDRD